jgi:hypothetical protein
MSRCLRCGEPLVQDGTEERDFAYHCLDCQLDMQDEGYDPDDLIEEVAP